MTVYRATLAGTAYAFDGLVDLMAKATPRRSGDELAGCAASTDAERAAAQWALADVELSVFLNEALVPYETDEVTRLIMDSHDAEAFGAVSQLTVGGFRDWLLDVVTRPDAAAVLTALAPGLIPEMVAAVSKLMRNQDLISVARATRVVTAFRTTVGLPGRLSTRLQPNHPTDDPRGIAAATLDGLLLGSGDAVIGINPATDSPQATASLLHLVDEIRQRYEIPTQSCVLSHVTTTLELINAGVPVDLVFQSVAGTQGANTGFGVDLAVLREANTAGRELGRGTVGNNVMYLETGQGSALSAGAHLGTGGRPVDQQTLEARAYAVCRDLEPLLVNTVVGFIGPEYLYDGKQIIRAGLEDHFCGKLLGLPMGVDVCYTNHAEADSDDMDDLLTLLGVAGAAFVIAVPGADDVMLGYQSLSFHDVLYVRQVLGLRPAPEFERWLQGLGMADGSGRVLPTTVASSPLRQLTSSPMSADLEGLETDGADPAEPDLVDAPAAEIDARLDDAGPAAFWDVLRLTTQSRIGLGRTGDALPTRRLLEFRAAHAEARDAVHDPLDVDALVSAVEAVGIGRPAVVASDAESRGQYLRRPDLGRRPASLDGVPHGDHQVGFVLADGLSPRALAEHGAGLLHALVEELRSSFTLAPPVIAVQARVALADHIAEAMGIETLIVLIGERPGLSVADSLGIYLTHHPRSGRTDADRNCVSNIHPPDGLDYEGAARVAAALVRGARQLGQSGVKLKDTSRAPLEAVDPRVIEAAPDQS